MYTDGTITTEFTGYWDAEAEEYVYPSARQNALLLNIIGADATAAATTVADDEEIPEEDDATPPSAYLSAMDSDFTSDGLTFTFSAGDNTDITIGTATSATMGGTALNPNGLLDDLAFSSRVKAFIGVETATESAAIPEGASAYIEYNPGGWPTLPLYAIGSVAYADGNIIRDMGEEIISISALPYLNSSAYFWTASGACLYFDEDEGYVPPSGSTCAQDQRWNYVADISTTGWGNFMQAKFADNPQSILMDGAGTGSYITPESRPTVYTWDAETGTKTIWNYIPMGIYDMSSVSIFGAAYTFEVFDRMTSFDAPAADWINSLDFTSPKTTTAFIQELMAELGFYGTIPPSYTYYTIDANAVNTATSFAVNPFLGMTVTFRQILAWFAEYMGCNVRMKRNGDIAFVAYDSTSVMTISPDVIVSQSRDVSRYTIAPVSQVTCYDVLGVSYSTGTAGQDYYIMNNPLFNLASNSTPVDNLLTVLSAIPAYNATAFTDACADPRIDAGDFITVERTDGTTYTAPVMHQALTWRGNTVTEYTATGNQVREAPSADDVTEYESTVNKNQLDNYVLKEGDTMTGDLENTAVNTRRTVMQGNRFYAENTNDTSQNAALYYNGVSATDGTHSSTLTPTGLDLDGTILTSAVGTQIRDSGTTSVPSGTYTATGAIPLTKGTWLITAYVRFPSNATGNRVLVLSTTSGSSTAQTPEYADIKTATNGSTTMLRVVVPRQLSGSQTMYMNAMQNSGAALAVTWVYNCVRIL